MAKVAELAQRTPEVVECHRITGEDCFIMRAHVRDVEHLEEVIDRFVAYGQTTTSIVQSSPVPRRGLALDQPPGGLWSTERSAAASISSGVSSTIVVVLAPPLAPTVRATAAAASLSGTSTIT